MVSVVNLALMGVVILLHTLLAAVMTRFFRLRLKTQWGYVVYSLFLIPLVLFVSTLVFSGAFGIGVDLGSTAAALGVMIGMPLALGFTIDTLYVPPPEEFENLPESQ
ncbi:hypothetical protein C440_04163 [Haloferax mucosum ATCC BAA-1512]|uniref:DUF7991 domain-containing protein n=1 Tax=Haloferax mucosum ATCC BAA-1512 TaxID=662479 RepID=M0IJL0_9EURY|nr:hypothetical protein [Haloferax mucosum]ELZ96940.1 hypothetical protein C440_04163 [Haloferax mucosum ATCC BAA-1512]